MRQYSFTPLINLHPMMDDLIKWATANFRDIENSSRVDVVASVGNSGAALSTLTNATVNQVPIFTGATTVSLLTVSPFTQTLTPLTTQGAWQSALGLGGAAGVFGASGASHSSGLVPDPGAVAGTTHFLREDATFAVPPTFVASGASHAPGYVPDPGASAGTTKFLREDATWQTPSDAIFVASGASHAAGDVPDPGAVAGTTRFLREDATFALAGPVLLNTLTASNSAFLSDTTSLTGTYSEYEIHLENVIPATNEKILQLQIHSGGAFKNAGYITQFAGDASGTAIGISSFATGVPLTYPADANADALGNAAPGLSGRLTIVTPSTSGLIMIYGTTSYLAGGGSLAFGTVQGYWNTSGVVDGFQLLMDSGNITSGTVKVYGIP